MRKIRFGLLLKFSISISILLILSAIVLSFLLMGVERFRVEGDLKNKGRLLARNLAYNSEYGILSKNLENLRRLVEGVMEESDVIYVQIYDDKGKVLAKEDRPEVKPPIFNVEVPIKSIRVERSAEEVGLEPLKEVMRKGKEEIIGKVKLGMSLLGAQKAMTQLLNVIISMTLSVIVMGMAGIYLLIRFILVKPLRQFLGATQTIAAGNLSQEVKIISKDEIGELADSFNSMVRDLRASRGKLEEKIAERTAELKSHRDRLNRILSTMTEGVVIEDKDYNVVYMNEALRKIFGDQTGKKCYKAFIGRDKPCPVCPIEEIIRKKKQRFGYTVTDKNGRLYELIATPLENPDGSISILEAVRDITEKKEAEKDLKEKMRELEEFHDLTVGRELKMVELEKEIERLKKEKK